MNSPLRRSLQPLGSRPLFTALNPQKGRTKGRAPLTTLPRPFSSGFTLLELLIVLVLTGLLTGIVAPKLHTAYTAIETKSEQQDILRQLSGLGYRASLDQRRFEIVSSHHPGFRDLPLDLPEGWRLVVAQNITFDPNGVCHGGTLSLSKGPAQGTYRLEPPICRPRPHPGPASAQPPNH